MKVDKCGDINLDNIDKITDFGFDDNVYTTDIYNNELMNSLNDVFVVGDTEDKFTCAVRALHKYELNEDLDSREQLIIQLFTEQQRLNIFEFFELRKNISDDVDDDSTKKWVYDDSILFSELGNTAVQLNEYSSGETQHELKEVIKVNLEDFSKVSEDNFTMLNDKTDEIIDSLIKSSNEVNMRNILKVFQQYLSFLHVKLEDDIVTHYCNYKGWKMIAILRQQESYKFRKALENRAVNLTTDYKISRFYYSKNVIDRNVFYDSLLEDLKKYERYVMNCYIDKSPQYYEDLLSSYYEIVLTALTLRDNSIDKYMSMVNSGYYNSKTNEKYLRKSIKCVYNKRIEGNLKLDKLDIICKKLHITTARAQEYDLRFMMLHTGLSQWMKSNLKSDNQSKKKSLLKAKWCRESYEKGRLAWKYHIKDKKTFKQIADESLVNLKDRELISKKYYFYIKEEFVKRDLSEEQYNDFADEMSITLNQFNKHVLK
ncbi:hypothetical protein [Companilactobacillus sp. FL22-1]|uniref:hypothetical protein n=1 Tax=Companilactobacillus sp. FL22-1 TaxID=3373892 RepID=UPI003754BFC6